MNITLELVHILDAIDRNGSFEAAAQELHKVRSALTYNVRKFEDRLGIKVFDRSEHRAKLTDAGRVLLEQGRQLLTLSSQIEQNIKQTATGWEPILRIAYDEIISMQPFFELIKQFQQQCPLVNLELYSEVLGGCTDALINDRVDIAIGLPGPLPNRSEFIFEPLGETKFVFAVAAQHPLAKAKEPISIDIIKTCTAIVARDSTQLTPPRTSMLLPEQQRMTFSSIAMKRQAQILGLGVGFLPYSHIKEDLAAKRLIVKQVERAQPKSYCYIAWNKNKKGKALQWLIKQLQNKNLRTKLLR